MAAGLLAHLTVLVVQFALGLGVVSGHLGRLSTVAVRVVLGVRAADLLRVLVRAVVCVPSPGLRCRAAKFPRLWYTSYSRGSVSLSLSFLPLSGYGLQQSHSGGRRFGHRSRRAGGVGRRGGTAVRQRWGGARQRKVARRSGRGGGHRARAGRRGVGRGGRTRSRPAASARGAPRPDSEDSGQGNRTAAEGGRKDEAVGRRASGGRPAVPVGRQSSARVSARDRAARGKGAAAFWVVSRTSTRRACALGVNSRSSGSSRPESPATAIGIWDAHKGGVHHAGQPLGARAEPARVVHFQVVQSQLFEEALAAQVEWS